MGGIGSTILSSLGKVAGPELKEQMGEVTTKALGSLESVAAKSEAGQALMKLWKNQYEPIMAKTRQSLTEAATSMYRASGATGPAPTVQIKGKPIQLAPEEITRQARNIASDIAFGKNHARIAHAVSWAEQTNGLEYAQTLADHIAMNMQDTIEEPRFKKTSLGPVQRGTTRISQVKRDIAFNVKTPVDIDWSAVYSERTPIERKFNNYASAIIAPLIAIPHLATPANLLFAPVSALTRGLAEMIGPGGYQATKQALLDSGIFNEEALNTYRNLLEYRNGIVGKSRLGPNTGYILGKLIHSPGFSAVRDWSLVYAGATGKFAVEGYAKDFAQTGSKIAAERLTELGLNPRNIARQGGQLSKEDYERAIYKFVDKHVFLGSKTSRSYYSQKNTLTRMSSMYHNYVTRQGQLLKNEFKLNLKAGNNIGVAKTLAVIGVAFPAIGAAVNTLEQLARGQWDEKQLEEPYERIAGAEGIPAAVEQYLDFISHVGGFGIATGITRGIYRNELSNMLIGPLGNIATRDITDASAWTIKGFEGKSPSGAQVGRDILEQTLPDNLGRVLTHRFLPTRAEEKERREGGLQPLKRLKGLKGLSKTIQ